MRSSRPPSQGSAAAPTSSLPADVQVNERGAPKFVPPIIEQSYCTSPAALCVELAEVGVRRSRGPGGAGDPGGAGRGAERTGSGTGGACSNEQPPQDRPSAPADRRRNCSTPSRSGSTRPPSASPAPRKPGRRRRLDADRTRRHARSVRHHARQPAARAATIRSSTTSAGWSANRCAAPISAQGSTNCARSRPTGWARPASVPAPACRSPTSPSTPATNCATAEDRVGPHAWPIVTRIVIEGAGVRDCRGFVPELATPWRADAVVSDRLRVGARHDRRADGGHRQAGRGRADGPAKPRPRTQNPQQERCPMTFNIVAMICVAGMSPADCAPRARLLARRRDHRPGLERALVPGRGPDGPRQERAVPQPRGRRVHQSHVRQERLTAPREFPGNRRLGRAAPERRSMPFRRPPNARTPARTKVDK